MDMKYLEMSAAYFCGAAVYGAMELCFRGGTHWTMPLTGGLCFFLFHLAFRRRPTAGMAAKCFFSCGTITLLELTVGWLVNIKLGWAVWDYSMHLLDVRGQICLLFSCFWFLMGIPMSVASRRLARLFLKLEARCRAGKAECSERRRTETPLDGNSAPV